MRRRQREESGSVGAPSYTAHGHTDEREAAYEGGSTTCDGGMRNLSSIRSQRSV